MEGLDDLRGEPNMSHPAPLLEQVSSSSSSSSRFFSPSSASPPPPSLLSSPSPPFQDATGKEQVDVQGDLMLDVVEFLTATWPEVRQEGRQAIWQAGGWAGRKAGRQAGR